MCFPFDSYIVVKVLRYKMGQGKMDAARFELTPLYTSALPILSYAPIKVD